MWNWSSWSKYTLRSMGGIDLNEETTSTDTDDSVVPTEVKPPLPSLDASQTSDEDWKIPIDVFTSKKRGDSVDDSSLSKGLKRFYRKQDDVISSFEEALDTKEETGIENMEALIKVRRSASILSKASFLINIAVAGIMTGSLAVITSVIDSAVDVLSGLIIWMSNRAIKRRNIYKYPQGRTKLEPVAIIILAVIMAAAAFTMIVESINQIISFVEYDNMDNTPENDNCTCETVGTHEGIGVTFTLEAIIICVITIVTKFILWMLCRRVANSSLQALAQDHRNDVLSNSVALACGLIADKLWKYADPIGAILICIYIIVGWFFTLWEQIKALTGLTADPAFLKKITWICINHHPKVQQVETVRAYHFGYNFLVEVHLVLPQDMSLMELHDIGEDLQAKLERLAEVERAFVHVDYNSAHHPTQEHKDV